MIGIRQGNGKQLYVAPYVKVTPLDQEFKLRRNANRTALEQHVRAQAKAYVYTWNAAA